MALLTSILTGGINNHPTTSEEANAWSTDFISEGIVGTYTNTSGVAPATGAFAVNAQGTPDMTVAVSTGVCYVQGTPTSQNSQTFRIKNTASSNVTIAANSSGSTKYDWVYIKLDATKLNGPSVAGDDATTLVTSRSTSQSSDDGTPPTYGYPIAVVTVSNGASSITNGNIRDLRANCIVNLGSSSVSSGWTELGYAPNTVTANGNRSYSLVFNSTDLTGTISNGMRLKLPRTVTAPTQCTSLNGTTQYYSRATGLMAGMTFTGSHTTSAWIKLSSYNGAQSFIVGRTDNSTGGYALLLTSSGQVRAFFGTASTFTDFISYQSIPLNKWVHVAASVNAAAKTAVILIDGVSVPLSSALTAATSVTQMGNFAIGALGTGVSFFPGKIAQAAVFSAQLSDATIKAMMNQTLTGSETSLVGAWTFNGNGNDSSANALNLTAQGSATATTTDSPMNATEYGIIMANSFSTNTTLTVQVPEGYSLPTSGGISLCSYSTQKTPYGFPGQKDKWAIEYLQLTSLSPSGTTLGTYYNPGGANITVPVGSYEITVNGTLYLYNSGAGGIDHSNVFLGTASATSAQFSKKLTYVMYAKSSATAAEIFGGVSMHDYISVTSATQLFINMHFGNTLTTASFVVGTLNTRALAIEVVNAYL